MKFSDVQYLMDNKVKIDICMMPAIQANVATVKLTSSSKLKRSKPLSLSAHSLRSHFMDITKCSSSNNISLKGDNNKSKTKNYGSLSISQCSLLSSFYTPPFIRRCNTLNNVELKKKKFKTLEIQRQQQQQQEHQHSKQQWKQKSRELNITRTLHRIPGTNKTYWKYGINPSQTKVKSYQQQQQQNKEKFNNINNNNDDMSNNLLNTDSNKSNNLGFDEAQLSVKSLRALLYEKRGEFCTNYKIYGEEDSEIHNANDMPSCSVPLTNDSHEMMRLMLKSAATAIITNPIINHNILIPASIYTDADECYNDNEDNIKKPEQVTSKEDDSRTDIREIRDECDKEVCEGDRIFSQNFTLSRYSFNRDLNNKEIVACNNFQQTHHYHHHHNQDHQLVRCKSFSGERYNCYNKMNTEFSTEYINGRHIQLYSPNTNRVLLKSSSADICEYNNVKSITNFPTTSTGIRTTIASTPLVIGMKTIALTATATTKPFNTFNTYQTSNQMENLLMIPELGTTSVATTASAKLSRNSFVKLPKIEKFIKITNSNAIITTATLLVTSNMRYTNCSLSSVGKANNSKHIINYTDGNGLLHKRQQNSFDDSSSNVINEDLSKNEISFPSTEADLTSRQLINAELEQHIKHCSCTCNHMGYGNSMDYQTTGFGGLPDVTEHSNIRRTVSGQNSTSNSDSGGELSNTQKKCKKSFDENIKSTRSVRLKNTETITNVNSNFKMKRNRVNILPNNLANRHKVTQRGSCVIGLTFFAAMCLLAVATVLLYQHFVMSPSRSSHVQRMSIVKRILRDIPLVDGHNNFAWNIRKYAHSSLELMHVSNDINHKSMWVRPAWAQTDMARLKLGQVGVQVWSAFVPCEAQGLDAVQLALEQIDIIRRLADIYNQDTILVTSPKGIQTAQQQGLIASIIGIEGGHAIGSSLGVLRSFYSLGARYLSLTHKCDISWAGSSSSTLDAGLSVFGKAIVREMNRLGMMIDLSYSSDTTARNVLQATRAPVIFSHSAARQLCNSTRNIPDDILRMLAENGGLVMVSFDSEDVTCGRQAHLRDVINHIKYVRAIAGIQHVGLGAGYDSIEYPPIGLEDVSKYPDLLATLLEDVSWSEEDVAMLAGKNFLRIMQTVENVRDYWRRANIDPIEQTEPKPKTQCTYMSL